MGTADYSRASIEERVKVAALLGRNVESILSSTPGLPEAELREAAARLGEKILRGEVITGQSYRELFALLRKEWPA